MRAHSVASFSTEWRAWIISTPGAVQARKIDMVALGFTPEMAGCENDAGMLLISPEIADNAHYGPSRGHLFPKYARKIGMPRACGYGGAMGAWVVDYLSGWAGEYGMVAHSLANLRRPALSGDITIQTAEVTDKTVDAREQQRRHTGIRACVVQQCVETADAARGNHRSAAERHSKKVFFFEKKEAKNFYVLKQVEAIGSETNAAHTSARPRSVATTTTRVK